MLSSRFNGAINEAAEQARLSQANYKVGAVIMKKNQIIARGHNVNTRTQILRRYRDTSIHAEMSVANQLINRLVRRQTQRYLFSSKQEPKGQIV